MFCEFLWIFYINILSCGVFSEWEADGNFLTRVSGSEKYSIFRPVGINMTNYTKPVWALLGKALSCSHARHGPSQWASTPSLRLDWKTWKTTGRKTEKEWNKQTNKQTHYCRLVHICRRLCKLFKQVLTVLESWPTKLRGSPTIKKRDLTYTE